MENVRGFTWVSTERLFDAARALTAAIANNVPGDWLETGTWKGGTSMVAAAASREARIPGTPLRRIFLADSFEGLPPPSGADLLSSTNVGKPMDPPGSYGGYGGVNFVKETMREQGLLSSEVSFLVGWFNETIPKVAGNLIKRLAVLRLDGDMYESTMVVLDNMYPLVSIGGYVIIDDYGHWPQCKLAVDDYFAKQGISPTLYESDYTGRWFRKGLADVGILRKI